MARVYVRIPDISKSLEPKAISFVNELDEELLPDVQYITENIAGPGADEDDFEVVSEGCNCSDMELCGDSCPCIKRFGANYDPNGCIYPDILAQSARPVIECSSICRCHNSCPNRVVQKGTQYCLQVFKTKNKGFGIKTLDPISQYSFVCEYVGEIIGKDEAKKRAQAQGFKNNYIFVLREHLCHGDVLETVVDPTYVGNVGRYLNHSCTPNLFVVPVRTDCMVPKLCFFAISNIPPLAELCYDYSGFTQSQLQAPIKDTSIVNRKLCYCESLSCCGVLPYDPLLL